MPYWRPPEATHGVGVVSIPTHKGGKQVRSIPSVQKSGRSGCIDDRTESSRAREKLACDMCDTICHALCQPLMRLTHLQLEIPIVRAFRTCLSLST